MAFLLCERPGLCIAHFFPRSGWAVHPQEGQNALAVYRADSERLYARKVMRVRPRPPAAARASRLLGLVLGLPA
ncbi:MAG TPA: hypothetical protein VKA24_09075 [Gaiellaceae bacterium]|nr:hypothetical protein [Gaiellaceae bacterium]